MAILYSLRSWYAEHQGKKIAIDPWFERGLLGKREVEIDRTPPLSGRVG